MTDENNSLAIDSGADPQSLSYTPDAPEPKPVVEAKPMTSREALEKAAADIEAKEGTKIGNDRDDKEEAKAEPKVRAENGKFAKTEVAAPDEDKAETENNEPSAAKTEEDGTEQDGEPKRSSEDRDLDKPPARFLPRAKEKWADVDPDVRVEVTRAFSEMEKGLNEHRESHEFRKELREFEDMAKAAGTTVKGALANYVAIDQQLKTDPVNGIARILQSIGVTPQQYAQHILSTPQKPPADPNISRLEQTVQQLSQQLQQQQQTTQQTQEQRQMDDVMTNVIAPFRATLEDDRYDELEQDIAFFLNSDRIPSTLSAQKRLAAAYDMAERINPVGYASQSKERLKPAASADRPLNPAGAKSIKGAPGGTTTPKGATLNTRDAVDAAMRQLGI